MRKQEQNLILQRSTSTIATRLTSTRRITPSNHHVLFRLSDPDDVAEKLLVRRGSSPSISSSSSFKNNQSSPPPTTTRRTRTNNNNKLSVLMRSFLCIFTFPTMIPACKFFTIPSNFSITPSTGRKVTGTLFGHRRGHISFAVQLDPREEPLLLLELAISTASLVKEMSSGLVRIALECEKVHAAASHGGRHRKLFQEPAWTMYCNGRKCGYAVSRTCGEREWHVLRTVQSVSVGAGVIPLLEDGEKESNGGSEGELMYMRARFERVVGSRDSEAFYMLNPDGSGGPELSIFLLRI
ncbi:protein MIZU-KUSSEI 1 [Arachis stenosperma]|uniref:protein MIZU-KUSSEI 1 n=1 Tax=Arachis stenosperma TaxID=217475 RepID=UPI0025ABD051|nr:protein MIZU-KUSSEI 1 [Arachis stenosperma]